MTLSSPPSSRSRLRSSGLGLGRFQPDGFSQCQLVSSNRGGDRQTGPVVVTFFVRFSFSGSSSAPLISQTLEYRPRSLRPPFQPPESSEKKPFKMANAGPPPNYCKSVLGE
jgi:hypothetical protein